MAKLVFTMPKKKKYEKGDVFRYADGFNFTVVARVPYTRILIGNISLAPVTLGDIIGDALEKGVNKHE